MILTLKLVGNMVTKTMIKVEVMLTWILLLVWNLCLLFTAFPSLYFLVFVELFYHSPSPVIFLPMILMTVKPVSPYLSSSYWALTPS